MPLEFRSPGFPVFKAHVVPLRGGHHSAEMTEQDVRDWERVLYLMNQFLRLLTGISEKMKVDRTKHERYEFIGDAITWFLRIPLMRAPLMGLVPHPFTYYMVFRLMHPRTGKEVETDTLTFVERCFEYSETAERLSETVHEVTKLLGRLWFRLPADTRPVYNTSGLIPHMLLTSAIAWGMVADRGLSREDAGKLRLSAVFHDASKPFDFERHYCLAPDVIRIALDGVLAEKDIAELESFVRTHHLQSETELGKVLHQADVIAAASDRLSSIAREVIYPKIREMGENPEVGYGSGSSAWEFWRQLERKRPGTMLELTEEGARAVLSSGVKSLRRSAAAENHETNLDVCLIDVGSIQDFVMGSSDLRSVAAASLAVDFATLAHIPLLIQFTLSDENVWVPLEAFMVVSGGTITALLPRRVADRLRREWRERIARHLDEIELRTYFASSPFTGNYVRDSAELAKRTYIEKLVSEPASINVQVPEVRGFAPRLCVSCHTRPATDEEGRCHVCAKLRRIGTEFHFGKKWNSGFELTVDGRTEQIVPRKCYEMEWERAREGDVMYVIAGHDGPFLEPGERERNYAVVKVDGNLMGLFFAETVSPTDLLERSARVDIALKSAIEMALAELFSEVSGISQDDARKAVAACFLGTLYAGGDDALILCPSWCAIHLASRVSQHFSEELGGVRALSAGVAAAPAEHSVWALIEAASWLLEVAKKKVGREQPSVGGIAFDFVEGGILSGSSAAARHAKAEEAGITLQPYAIWDSGSRPNLSELMGTLLNDTGFGYAYKASRVKGGSEYEEVRKYLKRLREAAVESIGVSRNFAGISSGSEVLVIHVSRMAAREGSESAEQSERLSAKRYERLMELVRWSISRAMVEGGRLAVPLADVLTLIKFLGGGTM